MPPKVSVLFPVRNGAAFLPDALSSLRDQTFEDFEVVAVDDGSADGSLALLDGFAKQDPRFVVLKQDPLGIVAALEKARFAARGSYLARMDADDIAPPDRLARQVARMEADPTLALCGIGVRYFPRDLLKEGRVRYEAWLNSLITHEDIVRDIFVECPLAHPTFLMKASWVASVDGYQEGPWPEDYDLVLRLWEKGARFARIDGEPLLWRDHPARLSRQDQNYWMDGFRRLKVEVLVRRFLGEGRRVVIWGAGPTGKAFSKELAKRGITPAAFVEVAPGKIGQTIHDAPVIPPQELGDYAGSFCLAAVSGVDGRTDVRASLARMGWVEMQDFVAVA